jgi:hypothetical protein
VLLAGAVGGRTRAVLWSAWSVRLAVAVWLAVAVRGWAVALAWPPWATAGLPATRSLRRAAGRARSARTRNPWSAGTAEASRAAGSAGAHGTGTAGTDSATGTRGAGTGAIEPLRRRLRAGATRGSRAAVAGNPRTVRGKSRIRRRAEPVRGRLPQPGPRARPAARGRTGTTDAGRRVFGTLPGPVVHAGIARLAGRPGPGRVAAAGRSGAFLANARHRPGGGFSWPGTAAGRGTIAGIDRVGAHVQVRGIRVTLVGGAVQVHGFRASGLRAPAGSAVPTIHRYLLDTDLFGVHATACRHACRVPHARRPEPPTALAPFMSVGRLTGAKTVGPVNWARSTSLYQAGQRPCSYLVRALRGGLPLKKRHER